MTRDDAARAIVAVINEVAPDVGVESLTDDCNYLEELDLDSMDFLNIVIGVHESTGVDIPERAYDAIRRFGDFVTHLVASGEASGDGPR